VRSLCLSSSHSKTQATTGTYHLLSLPVAILTTPQRPQIRQMVPALPFLPDLRPGVLFRVANRVRDQHRARLWAAADELRCWLWARSVVCGRLLFLDSDGGAVLGMCVWRVFVRCVHLYRAEPDQHAVAGHQAVGAAETDGAGEEGAQEEGERRGYCLSL
jgi:hypothetical protein